MADEHHFGTELVTPESALFAGPATAVILRTSDGDLTVLDGHTDLVGDVVAGVVRVEVDGEVNSFCVHGGFLQVRTATGAAAGLVGDLDATTRSTRVTVLAGVAEAVTGIDVARAQAARDAAAAQLQGLPADDSDPDVQARRRHAEGALARAELRLESAGVSVA
jgi:F-type H+-transporting ATPase subunit epsilon